MPPLESEREDRLGVHPFRICPVVKVVSGLPLRIRAEYGALFVPVMVPGRARSQGKLSSWPGAHYAGKAGHRVEGVFRTHRLAFVGDLRLVSVGRDECHVERLDAGAEFDGVGFGIRQTRPAVFLCGNGCGSRQDDRRGEYRAQSHNEGSSLTVMSRSRRSVRVVSLTVYWP